MGKEQNRQVEFEGALIEYRLIRKPVKNINLRIKQAQDVVVSANERVSALRVDAFVLSKGPWILKIMARLQSRPVLQPLAAKMTKDQKRACIQNFQAVLDRLLPYFEPFGVTMPALKIRCMKSRWGSCAFKQGTITLNSQLLQAPEACLEYVVAHELAHFIHPNHSSHFYAVLSRVMPDHKARKKLLESQGRML